MNSFLTVMNEPICIKAVKENKEEVKKGFTIPKSLKNRYVFLGRMFVPSTT